jgi:sec-independent protein translocase protein TatC
VAITTPRRRPKNPEGRMPLGEHLRELRRRLLISALAVVAGGVGGWFLYEPLFDYLQAPLLRVAREHHITANINFADVTSSFNLRVKLALYLGLVIASPVWLYQLWAFIVPGLTKKERRISMIFVGAAVPLFLAGIFVAWLVVPNAVAFFASFAPEGSSVLTNADTYLTFVTRTMLAFGVAFLLPLFLVALNYIGVISGKALAKGWRIAVFVIFLFAAIASPTPDAVSMLVLAFPMCGLYLAAVWVATMIDRARSRRDAAEGWGELDDDQASRIEDTASPVEPVTRIDDRTDHPTARGTGPHDEPVARHDPDAT